MTVWMWVRRCLPLIPVLPALTILMLVHVCARGAQAGLVSWTRLQLAAFVMASFCVLKVATVIAGHGIAAYGLGE